MKTQLDYIKLGKTLVAAAMLSVLLAFVAVPRSQADDRGKCQHSAERAQAKLNDAIARYGGNSQQAINRWHQLNAVREQCWNQYHAWYSPTDRQWHNERNWENYDRPGAERGPEHH